MRIYTGKKRHAKKLCPSAFNPRSWEHHDLLFLSTLKPGDYIFGDKGFNVRVKFVEFQRYYSRSGKSSVVCQVVVGDETGRLHYYDPPYSYIGRPKTKAEIEAYLLSWSTPEYLPLAKEWSFTGITEGISRLEAGLPICDENGVICFEY